MPPEPITANRERSIARVEVGDRPQRGGRARRAGDRAGQRAAAPLTPAACPAAGSPRSRRRTARRRRPRGTSRDRPRSANGATLMNSGRDTPASPSRVEQRAQPRAVGEEADAVARVRAREVQADVVAELLQPRDRRDVVADHRLVRLDRRGGAAVRAHDVDPERDVGPRRAQPRRRPARRRRSARRSGRRSPASPASRNSRGRGLPSDGSADTEPISTCPNPSADSSGTARALLSNPAASPSGVANRRPGDLHGQPRVRRSAPRRDGPAQQPRAAGQLPGPHGRGRARARGRPGTAAAARDRDTDPSSRHCMGRGPDRSVSAAVGGAGAGAQPPSSALTSPLRIASSAISARWSATGISSSPSARPRWSSSACDGLERDPGRLRDLLVARRVDALAVDEQRPAQRAQDALLLLGEARRGAQLAGHERRAGADRHRIAVGDHRPPHAHEVAVVQAPAAGEPQPVDPRAVLGQPVVGDRPLARVQLELRVQPRQLGIPGDRDVGLVAAADRHRGWLPPSVWMTCVPSSSR